MKKISFIIPVYNAEDVIERCLKSILKIRESQIEVIVIDDGSTDYTYSKIEEIKDERIVLISQNNGGVSEARNNGLKKAQGIYVAFVDADDYINSEKYSTLIDKMNDNDFIMFNYEMVYSESNIICALPLTQGKYSHIDAKDMCERLYDIPFSKNYKSRYFGGKVYQYLFNREFLEKNNIYFKSEVHFAEDCLFCLNCFKNVKKFEVIDEVLYYYAVIESSASHKYREQFWEELIKSYSIGCEIYGNVFKHKNEIYFYYGDEVVRRTVSYGLIQKKNIFAAKAVKRMINNTEFQNALQNLEYTEWTRKERFLIYAYKKKYYGTVYILYAVIMFLKKIAKIIRQKKLYVREIL